MTATTTEWGMREEIGETRRPDAMRPGNGYERLAAVFAAEAKPGGRAVSLRAFSNGAPASSGRAVVGGVILFDAGGFDIERAAQASRTAGLPLADYMRGLNRRTVSTYVDLASRLAAIGREVSGVGANGREVRVPIIVASGWDRIGVWGPTSYNAVSAVRGWVGRLRGKVVFLDLDGSLFRTMERRDPRFASSALGERSRWTPRAA